MVDHSLTYRRYKFRNIPHIIRLRAICAFLRENKVSSESYADIGCSNGYLTNIIARYIKANNVIGFDHSKNILDARTTYPQYNFKYINLNEVTDIQEQYQFISCFETLEHVGNWKNGITNITNYCAEEGKILITIPVEIGLLAALKNIVKLTIYRDDFPLPVTKARYIWSVLLCKDVSKYRLPAEGYGPHFGFDYRQIEKFIKENHGSSFDIKCSNKLNTRFIYMIKK